MIAKILARTSLLPKLKERYATKVLRVAVLK
jgi:hypothetical protein